MNIVEEYADHISLEEAARIAGKSPKTLRRAIQDGQFPRIYVASPRGPRLVFKRADLMRWIESRDRSPRADPASLMQTRMAEECRQQISTQLADLQHNLDAHLTTLNLLSERMQDQESTLKSIQKTLALLSASLTPPEQVSQATGKDRKARHHS